MEKLVNLPSKDSDSLALKSSAGTTIAPRLNEPSGPVPEWVALLDKMAMDKRHDLAPGILPWWREKLKAYTDTEICAALQLYSGQYFPSVDEIVELIERRKLRAAEEKQDNKTSAEYQENWNQIERFMDAHDGKTPQQVWCEENREEVERLNALLPGKEIHVKSGQEIRPGSATATDANAGTKAEGGRDDMENHQAVPAPSPHDAASVQSDGQSSKEAQ